MIVVNYTVIYKTDHMKFVLYGSTHNCAEIFLSEMHFNTSERFTTLAQRCNGNRGRNKTSVITLPVKT